MADELKGQVRYPNADGVVFGAGCVREQLTSIVEQQGIQRAFLVSTPSLTRTVQRQTKIGEALRDVAPHSSSPDMPDLLFPP